MVQPHANTIPKQLCSLPVTVFNWLCLGIFTRSCISEYGPSDILYRTILLIPAFFVSQKNGEISLWLSSIMILSFSLILAIKFHRTIATLPLSMRSTLISTIIKAYSTFFIGISKNSLRFSIPHQSGNVHFLMGSYPQHLHMKAIWPLFTPFQ